MLRDDLNSVIVWIKAAKSPAAIAKAAGLSRSTVVNVGEGIHLPNIATLEKLLIVKSSPPPPVTPAW